MLGPQGFQKLVYISESIQVHLCRNRRLCRYTELSSTDIIMETSTKYIISRTPDIWEGGETEVGVVVCDKHRRKNHVCVGKIKTEIWWRGGKKK